MQPLTLHTLAGLPPIAAMPCRRHTAPSILYGCAGEQWKPTSRLLDFSYAGYRAGDDPLPNLPPAVDIKAL